MNKNSTIAVIGLGLIGGSILRALRSKNLNLIGVSKSQETLDFAIANNIADEVSFDIDIVKEADIAFICTPINQIIQTIDEVRKLTSPDCIITDVASLKGFIIDYVNDYNFPTNFIGGHPMAGTENKGIRNSVDNLFEGAKWVLTPSKWTGTEDITRLEELIHYLGAQTIIANPYDHDRAVAFISHLPLLISQALYGFVSDYPDENIRELALKLAASGFRDTTRLAATNPELAKDMLMENKINVRKAAEDFNSYLSQFDMNIDMNPEEFIAKIEQIAEKRKSMYSADGKNVY